MMKLLTLVILMAVTASARPKFRDFEKQIYVAGVGQLKLVYKFTGEPVSRPRSLRVFVKCEKTKLWDPVGEYQMCELDDYQYDSAAKNLHVRYNDGRVNQQTGESFCDQLGENDLPLADLCKKP